jgi:hypothetical protein
MLEGRLVDIRAREGLSHTEDWKPHTDAAARSDLRSDVKGGTLTIPFTGTQIGLFGVARSDGGFGQVQLKDAKGEVVLTTIIETYCLYDEASLKFLSPKLPRGDYTLAVTVLGERFFWQAKTTTYGSRGDFVSVQKVLLTWPGSGSTRVPRVIVGVPPTIPGHSFHHGILQSEVRESGRDRRRVHIHKPGLGSASVASLPRRRFPPHETREISRPSRSQGRWPRPPKDRIRPVRGSRPVIASIPRSRP